jgi:hypothetical protein
MRELQPMTLRGGRLLLFTRGTGRLTPHFAGRGQDPSGDNGKEGKE